MRFFATASEPDSMRDSLNNIIHSIVNIFEDFVAMGESWGEPWDVVFPVFLALFLGLAFFGGFRYVFDLSANKAKPFFVFALAIVALLAFMAIRNEADQNATSNGLAVLSD